MGVALKNPAIDRNTRERGDRMVDSVSIEEYNWLQDKYNSLDRVRTEDSHYYKTCLNLSENKERLCSEATKLIDKHGILKALKISSASRIAD